jgi:hypothetical protein
LRSLCALATRREKRKELPGVVLEVIVHVSRSLLLPQVQILAARRPFLISRQQNASGAPLLSRFGLASDKRKEAEWSSQAVAILSLFSAN